MITVVNVNKAFEDGTVVLKDINTEFHPGKTNLIIGKSGSGKTVFVKCLIGLFDVDQGSIFYDDLDISKLSFNEKKKVRKNIGMLFQGNALFDSMNVESNVSFPLDMFTSLSYKDKIRKVNEVLDRVNLNDQNKKKPSELSGGMKKRVALARAIVMNPKYLFCDEPNSGLDPKTAMVIDELIQEITEEKNITTIVNTHDMNSVMEIGDRTVMLHKGQVHWTGTRHEILHANNPELDEFIFASNFLQRAKKAMLAEGR